MDTAIYEKTLKARKAELLARQTKINADLGQLKDADLEEQATENENDEVLEELGEVAENELIAIDAALERIANGTYGICTRNGVKISPERLAALPATPFCAECAAEVAEENA